MNLPASTLVVRQGSESAGTYENGAGYPPKKASGQGERLKSKVPSKTSGSGGFLFGVSKSVPVHSRGFYTSPTSKPGAFLKGWNP